VLAPLLLAASLTIQWVATLRECNCESGHATCDVPYDVHNCTLQIQQFSHRAQRLGTDAAPLDKYMAAMPSLLLRQPSTK
jgi:hypothetical protein